MKFLLVIAMLFSLAGCVEDHKSSDAIQRDQQEQILQEGTAAAGMPAIRNFRERKLLKLIYELRDQEGLLTYTYIISDATGKLTKFCNSMGYAISDATGYTNPQKIVKSSTQVFGAMPQAEPNGLFTPDQSTSNWIICIDPNGKPAPVLMSGRFAVFPYEFR
jgi:hypothetical protein